MIYIFDDMDSINERFISSFIINLPIERRIRASKYRSVLDRNLCVLSYWLLCYALQKEYDILEYPRLSYRRGGKPFLTDYSSVFFNLSHCREGIACAISQNEVGIDIQDMRKYNQCVAKRICTDEELKQLETSPHPEHLFCEFWSIKESYVKQIGAGVEWLQSKVSSKAVKELSYPHIRTFWGTTYHMCCLGESSDIIKVTI